MRLLLIGSLCLLVGLSAAARADDVPEGIQTLFDDLKIAYETEDVDTISSHFGPLHRLEAEVTPSGPKVETAKLFEDHEAITVEIELSEVVVNGDRARLRADYQFKGVNSDDQTPWEETIARSHSLRRQGPFWVLTHSGRMNLAAQEANISGQDYSDAGLGMSVKAPGGWDLDVVDIMGYPAAAINSPDLKGGAVLLCVDLPVAGLTAAQIVQTRPQQLTALAPTFGLTYKLLGTSQTTLGGHPALENLKSGGLEYQSQQTYVVIDDALYVFVCAVEPASAFSASEAEFAAIADSVKLTGKTATQVPAELGRMEGRDYVNDEQGCRITAPEGWKSKITKGQHEFQVVMTHPDGQSSITLLMVNLPEAVTAKQAIEGDEATAKTALQGYKNYRQGPITINGMEGYEGVSEFDLGGVKRGRWRVYVDDGTRLFVILNEAVPSTQWQTLEPTFEEAVYSFELFAPAQ